MTHVENERLGIVETQVKGIAEDLAEVKRDLKVLLEAHHRSEVEAAMRAGAETAIARSRSSTGVWLRFFSERFIAIIAILLSAWVAVHKG